MSTVLDCKIIEFDKHTYEKGNVAVVERSFPFDVKRVYYMHNVPGEEARGKHAHRKLYQLIIAASGRFTVTLNDGKATCTFTLDRPYQGLLIVPGIWRELDNFSSGSVCLVLASHEYNEDDYIRNFDDFLKYKQQ